MKARVTLILLIVFSATGLLLLQIHAGKRPSTWPIVSLGLIIPLLLLVVLVHH